MALINSYNHSSQLLFIPVNYNTLVQFLSGDRRPTPAARTGARSILTVNQPINLTGGSVCRRRLPGVICPNPAPRLGTD